MKKLIILISLSLLLSAQLDNAAAFTEPNMADYTAFPINTAQSVPPNIMIMLDNSGSMNFNAYGTYPGDGGTVSDAPFTGEPYSGIKSFQMTSGQDDAEEGVVAGSVLYHVNPDLDLGSWTVASNDSIVGIRIQDVAIPQGATIHSAYFEFNANASNAETSYFLIEGEYSDDAAPFDAVADNLKDRTPTTATVAWDNVQAWTEGQYYPTPDITTIVQEIVDRGGWTSGNSMVFRFTGVGTTDNKRDIRAYDANSGTAPTLHVVFSDESVNTRYYGYFNPDYFYNYNNQRFNLAYKKVAYDHASSSWSVESLAGASSSLTDAAIVSGQLWDGNWLNWLSMRRVDVLRKVLMGGLATARTGGGNQVNYGETPAQSNRVFMKGFDSSIASAVSPYDGNAKYRMEDGRIYVDADLDDNYETNFNIRIQKDIDYEPEEFVNGNLVGVLQKVGDKARWGNIWFNGGTGANQSGGTVEHTIGTNMTTMVTDLQNTGMDTWTPLAEAFYVAMQYFKQEDPQSGLDYPNNAVPNANLGDDPYHNGTEYVSCAKSFVLLLTDGASTKDAMIPDTYKDFDGDGKEVTCDEDSCNYPSGGSDYLDDLALYARTQDLRADLDGDQNLVLYAIHAFDKDPNASGLLRDAARNGGFDDRDGDNLPDGDYTSPADQRLEWDKDGDGEPDTFFEASDGYELEARLLQAITDILKRASSGTTASVLATNNLGAGNSVQSYYRPMVTSGLAEANWLGYLQSLWVDPWGNLREDSNANLQLDLRSAGATNTADSDVDRIVQMVNNGTDTILRRYTSHYLYNSGNGGSAECKVADCTPVYEDVSLDDVQPLFEAGKVLSNTDTDDRKIFTYTGDTGVVASNDEVFDNSGDVVLFDTGLAEKIKPFLGVRSDTVWGDGGAGLGVDQDTRVTNIIEWIRGTDISGLRNRTLNKVTWRLGDIVHSTPVVVGPAKQYFHLLYDHEDYVNYINYRNTRETVVYVGANDGMLHAYTNYVLKKKDDANQTLYYEALGGTTEPIGHELWAYIPQSVLPHLKWTASLDYTHTYYVNSQPRIFDAKVLPDDMYYTDDNSDPNYGTFMVFGLNMGGKDISVNEDFGSGTNTVRDFSPTYVLMDITDPRKPRVLWERSYTGLGMSSSIPAPVHTGTLDMNSGKWFLVFGSGATDYDHAPDDLDTGHIFVVDMLTGEPYGTSATEDWIWESSHNSYFNAPIALDFFQSNNVDAIYLGESYFSNSGSKWQADILKITIPCSQCEWSEDPDGNKMYDRDEYLYSNDPYAWSVSTLFEADGPVTAKFNLGIDPLGNEMVYFGTGRYLNDDDKIDTNQQYLYCVKDPFYNPKYDGSYYHDFGNVLTLSPLTPANLMESDNIVVTSKGNVSGYSGYTDFSKFRDHVRAEEDGWYLSLSGNSGAADPAERIISQVAVYGGLFLTPTFSPSSDLCDMGGETTFLAGYYETGTGFIRPVFTELPDGAAETDIEIRSPSSYTGMPPSRLVLHDGQEKGTMVTIQLGTGEFLQFKGIMAFSNENAVMEYTDDPNQAPLPNPACDWGNDDTNIVTDFPTSPTGP